MVPAFEGKSIMPVASRYLYKASDVVAGARKDIAPCQTMSSVRYAALVAATAGTIVAALISAPLWQANDIYARRRASAGAGDMSLVLGLPVALLVVPAAFALHRPGSGPDPQSPQGLTNAEATAATVISIAGNWALWAAVGALVLKRFRTRED